LFATDGTTTAVVGPEPFTGRLKTVVLLDDEGVELEELETVEAVEPVRPSKRIV
jgi:hypothetical protein